MGFSVLNAFDGGDVHGKGYFVLVSTNEMNDIVFP